MLGFDDVLPAAVATPGITPILHQPLKKMGLLAAEWMLEAVEERERGSEQMPKLYKAQPKLFRLDVATARE